jgi:DNA-binding MarR family transcriptional regulator
MQRIAEGLGLDVTTFSRQVKALEGKGLVARRASAEDRRVSILELTPTGGALLERIDRYMAERISTVFAHMSDFEQDTVVRSLGLLNQALTKIGETDTNREGIVVCCK